MRLGNDVNHSKQKKRAIEMSSGDDVAPRKKLSCNEVRLMRFGNDVNSSKKKKKIERY